MASDPESPSALYGISALSGLAACKLEVASAVIGAIWVGYAAIAVANRLQDDPWSYLGGGGIFVAVAVVCRWWGRA